jgi:putative colanic acid biosynthesis UDP-glucose lipid carrier transferase
MAAGSTTSYTPYIRLASILTDVLAVILLHGIFFKGLAANSFHLGAYLVASWSFIAYFSGYYDVYRYTPLQKVVFKLIRQLVVFTTAVVAFFLVIKTALYSPEAIALYIGILFGVTALFKLGLYFHLKSVSGTTGTSALIIGYSPLAQQLGALLSQNNAQAFSGFFSAHPQANVQGSFADAMPYAVAHNIDVIYCSLAEVTKTQAELLISSAAEHQKTLKFIPDAGSVFAKNLYMDYYEEFPLLSLQKTALHNPVAQVAKRVFDVVFSSLVMVFVFSWLFPLVALFIKLESKGPVFFMQIRVGMDGKEFWCYKFRSMKVNNSEGKLTVKNDPRITKTGKFLRKTSLDEMPQFINVLLGNMSVVGPRPKVWSHHNEFKDHIYKFMDRLNVKPGITGLAQVSGCRGEINSDADMQNRIRYDVFYIEHWSMLLDIRIIIQTVVNIFMGEEKAF